MLHRIRNLRLAMKVPKQLMQKLKAKPQSPKKRELKKESCADDSESTCEAPS